MAFSGFPHEALDFYTRLEADNTKVFWEANKATYKSVVRASVESLCDELPAYGPFHLFRPYNDVRFSKGKPPYKTQQGAYGETEGGAGFYVQLSAQGLMVGAGYYAMAKDQLERFRAAVDAEHTGSEIAGIVGGMSKQYRFTAIDELKTAPRGFPVDHRRIELIRRKGLILIKEFGAPAWIHTKQAATKIRGVWEAAGEMNAWLDTHVGASDLEPEGFFR